MAQILFQNPSDVNNEWLFYIENEAKSLAQRDDFAIQNFIDREIYNPEVMAFLESTEFSEITSNFEDGDFDDLKLNLIEDLKSRTIKEGTKRGFKKLKRKIKRVFCDVVRTIEDVDSKGIIRAMLLALFPFFAGGIPVLLLPIIIGIIAYLIKRGFEAVCPA